MTDFKVGAHPLCYTIAGSLSGIISRVCGQPLDVLKIRFQLQNQQNDGKLKYEGVARSACNIAQREGLAALWKGHVPAQVLSIAYGVATFNTYELSRRQIYKSFPRCKDLIGSAGVNFFCGGMSGIVAVLVCQPLDVIRTRLVWQENFVYRGMFHAILQMIKENGIRTFYKGVVPALAMVYPYAGFHFAFYGFFRNSFKKLSGQDVPGKISQLVCGAASGVCSKLILLPTDNVKKRLQVAGFQGNTTFCGVYDCFRSVVKEQGYSALYRGASAALIKSGVVAGITFFTYEQALEYCYTIQSEMGWT